MNSQRPRNKKSLFLATTRGISVLLIIPAASYCLLPAPRAGRNFASQGGSAVATAPAVAVAAYRSNALATAPAAPRGGTSKAKEAVTPQASTAIHRSKTDTLPAATSFSYTFETAEGNTATIELRQLSGLRNLYLQLQNPNCQEIATDDDSGSGQVNLILRSFEATGTYAIVVGSHKNASGGQSSGSSGWNDRTR